MSLTRNCGSKEVGGGSMAFKRKFSEKIVLKRTQLCCKHGGLVGSEIPLSALVLVRYVWGEVTGSRRLEG